MNKKEINQQLLETLKEVDNFFNWGGFDIDFSNGNICNGIDEGDVLGNNAMVALIDQIQQAIGDVEEMT